MTYETTLSFNTLHYESKKLVGHTLEIVQIVSDYPHCKLMYNKFVLSNYTLFGYIHTEMG